MVDVSAGDMETKKVFLMPLVKYIYLHCIICAAPAEMEPFFGGTSTACDYWITGDIFILSFEQSLLPDFLLHQ